MYQIYSSCKEAFEYFQSNNFLPKLKIKDLCSNVFRNNFGRSLAKICLF